MKKGGFKVDQIENGNVKQDYDYSYSPKEIREVISKYFQLDDTKKLIGTYNGKKYKIHAKNITYLGNPWESYKKRIQLWDNFQDFIQSETDEGYYVIALGVYHYNETLIFAEFDAYSYLNKASNNSAAHIQTYDLQRALDEGVYEKIDRNDHKVTAFTPENTECFLKIKFMGETGPLENLKNVFKHFYSTVPVVWDGVSCYKEMLETEYKDRRQTEWAGFYHEYRFSSFLEQNPLAKQYVLFQKAKKKGELDLDLYFPELKTYGDLKAHTIGDAILGNSYDTLDKALQIGPLYYVICEHNTIKDVEFQYQTLHYWHNYIREASKRDHDIERLKGRMKGQVILVDFVILQIDKYNYKYLSSFQEGFANSNGVPRNKKFEINENDISNFIVYKQTLE